MEGIGLQYGRDFRVCGPVRRFATGRLKHGWLSGVKVEFNVGPAEGFGAMQLFCTGNPAFNVRCRAIATQNGWSLNQYGL